MDHYIENKKVMFIEPPFFRLYKHISLNVYPLSLGSLSGMVQKETDWDVMAYNADFSPKSRFKKMRFLAGDGFNNYLNNLKNPEAPIWQEVKQNIEDYGPSVVSVTSKSHNHVSACNVARVVKEIDDSIITVFGGPHPSLAEGAILEDPHIDICVRGEGECTVVELLKAIGSGDGHNGIRGISYKEDGKVIDNPPRELIKDLEILCVPAENAPEVLKDFDKYPPEAFENVMTVRGCPNNCTFCGSRNIWTRKPRFRSPGHVVKELKILQRMGVKRIHFQDDSFGVNRRYLRELCEEIERECPGIKWMCHTTVRLIDDETVQLMKNAGCIYISIGVESGNNEVLKAMRKNLTIEEAYSAFRTVKRWGLGCSAYFMLGFYAETEETILDTYKAIRELDCDHVIYSIFAPYPGTEAFDICLEKGYIDENFDVTLHNHQSPENCFCDIDPGRFRELAGEIERYIDRMNKIKTIERNFSIAGIKNVYDFGITKAVNWLVS